MASLAMSSSRSSLPSLEAQPPKHVSRIPTKSSLSSASKQSKAAQHVSSLAKRASKSITLAQPLVKSTTTTTTISATPHSTTSSTNEYITSSSMSAPALLPTILRTPSLVTGSSVSSFSTPTSNTLRRKPSDAIGRHAANKRTGTDELEAGRLAPQVKQDIRQGDYDNLVWGIPLPSNSEYAEQTRLGDPRQNGYDHCYQSRVLTPPVPGYAPSATPSTRYTDSPFSHVLTPSSASSYSPALTTTSAGAIRPLQPSSPSPRSKASVNHLHSAERKRLGLPPVRESSTSSSNSTVRPATDFEALTTMVVQSEKSPKRSLSMKSGDRMRSTPRKKLTKAVPVAPPSKHPPQVPPELAHLNNIDASPTHDKSLPPARPTRDGTSIIPPTSGPWPIVQSDLPRLYTTYHKRTPSQETPVSATSPSLKSRFGLSSRSSSKSGTPRIDSAISPPPAARHFNRGPTPEIPSSEGPRLQRQDSPAVITSASPAKSPRFGIFSRKPKADAKVTEKPRRLSTKGPIAGTGHEGYGRFGIRGRSGSATSSTEVRSPSTDSTSSGQHASSKRRTTTRSSKDASDLDDFLRDRLNPVILRGSGSTWSHTASSSDLPGTSLRPVSSKSSSVDSFLHPQLLPSAMGSSESVFPTKQPSADRRWPSDSSDDGGRVHEQFTTHRRSFTRLPQAMPKSARRGPPPINTNVPIRNLTIDSDDAEDSTHAQNDCRITSVEDETHHKVNLLVQAPSVEPPPRQRRWNFLQRATASPRSKGKERAIDSQTLAPGAQQLSYRPVAHYAMMDPVEPIGLEEVTRIVHEVDSAQEDSMSDLPMSSKVVPYERRHTSLLPSPPLLDHRTDSGFSARSVPPTIEVPRHDSTETVELLYAQPAIARQAAHVVHIPRSPGEPQSALQNVPTAPTPDLGQSVYDTPDLQQTGYDTPEKDSESPRQPRLSPVGRIPAVISRRDRDRKLSDSSFSRPFARSQPRPSVKPPGSVYNQIRDMASPIEFGSQPVSSASTRSESNSLEPKSSDYTNAASTSTHRTSMEVHAQSDFFAFPPRKNSEQSYTTISSNPSWMTAIYTMAAQQDDVWNEYNDLLDEHMPLKTSTTSSSFGAPFQYSHMLFEDPSRHRVPSMMGQPPTSELPVPPNLSLNQTVMSVPQQISHFLQPSISPMLTPDTVAGFINGYGNRSTSTLFTSNGVNTAYPRASVQNPTRSSVTSMGGSISSSRHSRSSSLPEPNTRNSQAKATPPARAERGAPLKDIVEVPNSLAPSTNLRYGALMTSKWLSFGRVLFSPAHNEMQLSNEPRILIVDGLSSDWSYYVALNYPDAEVYNMGLGAAGSPSFEWPEMDGNPPPKHHQISLPGISASFPFPKGFFTAVVFRFPTATTEEAYAACVFECKRVLRPGGFLEVAVLDLDLMNMGGKGRRAVRGLKTRMQQEDCNVCLRNLSDILVRLIGRRGFEGVQRCIVGVPAAGRIPHSRDLSSASSDSSGMRRTSRRSADKDFTFSDLVGNASQSYFEAGKANDESITKMVAKVGRMWYSTCYEKALLPRDQSIWHDHGLLRECEKQGTSFRLLICHAQKPHQTRRRTVSV